MDELINGRTEEEIKAALRFCATLQACNESCPYYHAQECMESLIVECNALVDRLESRNAKLEAKQPKWISVEERLPDAIAENGRVKSTETVYAMDSCGAMHVGYFTVYKHDSSNAFHGVDVEFFDDSPSDITHWMPLPGLPKGGT